jgi:Protein of unknown function (DUF3987)
LTNTKMENAMSTTTHHVGFDIRQQIDFDHSGRAACPACTQDGKAKQKNLSVDLDTGGYRCWRGCTTDQIRSAIGQPKPQSGIGFSDQSTKKPTTISIQAVNQSIAQLQTSPEALDWLRSRGFTQEMIAHYRIGLSDWRDSHPSIAIHIPTHDDNRFYRKLRITPWVEHDLPKWSQYGVPTTIFKTYSPENSTATWFCEGEWDAMRLGWLARQQNAKVTICCSTTGCGAVPSSEQLNQLPGDVFIWFDRNDTPTKSGIIPGDEGAHKFAQALGDRARIAQVPMPENCTINGWDVSNALDAEFTWADFEQAAKTAIQPEFLTPTDTIKHQLTEILEQAKSPFHRDLALMNLSKKLGIPYRDLDTLAKSLKTSIDTQDTQTTAAEKLRSLLTTRPVQFDLTHYLEPWFADILLKTARAMPTAPEFLFTTLLPAAASRVGTAAQIVIKPSANYKQPMVFWSAIVAQSGSMKTPAQRVIIDPLVNLEKDAHEVYQSDFEAYECRKALGESAQKPIRKRYLTKDSTVETLQRIHSENPRGLLYYRDELAGAIKVRNQYRRGYGADEEVELDQWNGAAVLVDRADKSVCLPKSAICRTGAIQWEVLGELMGDHRDFNGAWSRWLFCAADAPMRYLDIDEQPDTGVSDALSWLYGALEKLPKTDYFLTPAAGQLFETWQHQLVDAQQKETASGLVFVYPKIEAYTARLALWLHIVNSALREQQPTQLIDAATMEKAIELAAYYLWQHRLIHTHNSPDSGLASVALKVQKYVERVGEATASKLKSGVRALRNMAAAQIRELMQTLANTGYGQVQGEGAEMKYTAMPPPKIDIDDTELTIVSSAVIPIEPTIEPPIDIIDKPENQPVSPLPHNPEATYQAGTKVEIWRDGKWLPARYLSSLLNSVLSHITCKLDDGHQVALNHEPFPPHRVATTDLRLAQDLEPTGA